MKTKLFLICPECGLESYIRHRHGSDIFFLTALGTVFNFGNFDYTSAVLDVITSRGITDIFVAGDSSCCFIRSVIEKEKGYNTNCEKTIRAILYENYDTVMGGKSPVEKYKQLAELNVARQIKELQENGLFGWQIKQYGLNVNGVVFNRHRRPVNLL